MEFLLYERKFKLIDDVLYSFYKKGGINQIERWYIVKLHLDKGYKRFSFRLEGKIKKFQYHRVVYLANNSDWNIYDNSKNNCIDHIDGIRTNNDISNLRNVTNQENCFNRTRCKGYCFDKSKGKYKAQIQLNGTNSHIGYFNTETEAREAYLNKKKELHKIQAR